MKISNVYKLVVFAFLWGGASLQAQDLEELMTIAFENSPKLKQYKIKHKRVLEKVTEVNTLPNTEVGVGVFVSTPETRTGAQTFKLSLKQRFPFFGTITARENYAASMADVAYQDIVITKRKLVLAVSQSYYQLFKNTAKQKVLNENIELLKTYEKLALTSVEVGKASAVDVLKLQIRQNELLQLKEVLEEQYIGETASLNKLLNRDTKTPVIIKGDLIMPKHVKNLSIDELKFHPELLKYDKLFNSVEKASLLNKKESKPMFGFGLDYVNVAKRPDLSFTDNGKDILMPMLTISVPIFNKKYSSKNKQYTLQKEEVLVQKQERHNVLETRLAKAITAKKAAMISYTTQLKNLKQAKNAQEILIKSYETGAIDFNDVLDIQELQLKFQMNMINSKVSFYNKGIIINYLTE